jgi:nifR3 family TIM-barrel protein
MGNCASVTPKTSPSVPVRIGPHVVANPVLLAPMSGVTDAAFRRLVHGHGAGLVITEMIAGEQLATAGRKAQRKAGGADCKPFVIQLVGCEARWMAEGARVAAGLGADIIDINMGCPAREVTGKLSGSALMRDLDHAEGLIASVLDAVSVPVTLKMRLGWDHATLNAPQLARRAEAAGVEMVTVHARTRCQFFNGAADWRLARSVKDAVRIPVVINGDIVCPASAKAALEASGADAVMIGRGAYGAPWMLGRVAAVLKGANDPGAPSLERQGSIAAAHVQAVLDQDGLTLGLRNARKHIGWYLAQSGRPADVVKAWRRRLCTNDNHRAVLADLAAFFAEAQEAA